MDINPETEKPYKHEDYSAAIVSFQLKDVIEQYPQNENYRITAKEISDFILGSVDLGRRLLWCNLVSGQLDADRADYLLRDSYHIGVNYENYDLRRLLVTLTVSMNMMLKSVNQLVLSMNAKELELRSTIIYVFKESSMDNKTRISRVKEIKPHFSVDEIGNAIEQLTAINILN